jgi:hypothetical protein
MRTTPWLAVAALAAAGVLATARGCHDAAPDEQLARRLTRLCDVARDHVATPAAGVRRLGRYLGSAGPEMLEELGQTLAAIERIEDDHAHDERAELARDRLRAPLLACRADWERFADAVADDPEATRLVSAQLDRLARTLQIIVGASQPVHELRDLLPILEGRDGRDGRDGRRQRAR